MPLLWLANSCYRNAKIYGNIFFFFWGGGMFSPTSVSLELFCGFFWKPHSKSKTLSLTCNWLKYRYSDILHNSPKNIDNQVKVETPTRHLRFHHRNLPLNNANIFKINILGFTFGRLLLEIPNLWTKNSMIIKIIKIFSSVNSLIKCVCSLELNKKR